MIPCQHFGNDNGDDGTNDKDDYTRDWSDLEDETRFATKALISVGLERREKRTRSLKCHYVDFTGQSSQFHGLSVLFLEMNCEATHDACRFELFEEPRGRV